ncbi:hypothetical protein TGFOU_316650B, partial [Toxoplasma gondii FOU]
NPKGTLKENSKGTLKENSKGTFKETSKGNSESESRGPSEGKASGDMKDTPPLSAETTDLWRPAHSASAGDNALSSLKSQDADSSPPASLSLSGSSSSSDPSLPSRSQKPLSPVSQSPRDPVPVSHLTSAAAPSASPSSLLTASQKSPSGISSSPSQGENVERSSHLPPAVAEPCSPPFSPLDDDLNSLGVQGASVARRLASFDVEQTFALAAELFPATFPSAKESDSSAAARAYARPEPPALPDGGLELDTASLFDSLEDETRVEALRQRLREAEFWFRKLRGDLFLWIEKALDLQARVGDAAKLQATQAFAIQELRREKRAAERQMQKERDSLRREREASLQEVAALRHELNQLKSRAAGADAAVRAAARVAAETDDQRGKSGEGQETEQEERAADKAALVSLTASVAALKTERDGLVGELYYERRRHKEVAEAFEQTRYICESEHLPNLEKLRASLEASEAERHEIQAQLIQYKIKYAESAFEELESRQQAMQQGLQHMQTVQQMKSLQLEVANLTSPRGLPDSRGGESALLSRHNSQRRRDESPSLLSRVCAALSPRDSREPRGPHDGATGAVVTPASPLVQGLGDGPEVDARTGGFGSVRGFADAEGGVNCLGVQAPRLAGSVIRSPRGPSGPTSGPGLATPGLAGAFAAVAPLASPRGANAEEAGLSPLSRRSVPSGDGGSATTLPSTEGRVQNPELEDQVRPLTSRMSGVPRVPPLRLGDFQGRLRDAGTSSPGPVAGHLVQDDAAQAPCGDEGRGQLGRYGSCGETRSRVQHSFSWASEASRDSGQPQERGWKETVTGTTRKWFGKLNRLTSRRTGEEEKKAHEARKTQGGDDLQSDRNLRTVSEAAAGRTGAGNKRNVSRREADTAETGRQRVGRSESISEGFSSSSRSSFGFSGSDDSSSYSRSRRSSSVERSVTQESFDSARPQPGTLRLQRGEAESPQSFEEKSGETATVSPRERGGEAAASSPLARARAVSLKGLARWGSSGGSLAALWSSALGSGKAETCEEGNRSPTRFRKPGNGETPEASDSQVAGQQGRLDVLEVSDEHTSASRPLEEGQGDAGAEWERGRSSGREEGPRGGKEADGREEREASLCALEGEEGERGHDRKMRVARRTTDPIEWLAEQ